MTDRRCIEDDEWDEAIDVGGGVRLLTTGVVGRAYLIEHRCKIIDGDQLIVGPGLSPGHQVTGTEPAVTITPSLLCPDCGLHGFVTDGVWRSC